MTERQRWDDIKASRPPSAARRHGYDKADRAIRVAFELRALREKRGLTQRELADRVGTTQSAIARLEAGHISPSLPTLDKVATALGAEVSLTIVDRDELTSTG